MKKIVLIFSLLLICMSCNKNNIEGEYPKEISFITIAKGTLHGDDIENIGRSSHIIFNDSTWQNLINQMNTYNNVSDNFTETNINFDTHTIIAVFGVVNTSGSKLEITSIIESEENIAISYGISKFANSVITQPYHLVKIPTTKKTIQL
jgi:hypothetical protein